MRVGARIREVLAILDQHGQLNYRQVWERHPEIELTNSKKYLSRAVGMGLVDCDRSVRPMLFTARSNWRQVIAEQRTSIAVAPKAATIFTRNFGAHNPFGDLHG